MPPKATKPAARKPSAQVAARVAKAAEAAPDISLAADPAAAPRKTRHSPEEVKEAKEAAAAKKKDDEVKHANTVQRVAQLELELL